MYNRGVLAYKRGVFVYKRGVFVNKRGVFVRKRGFFVYKSDTFVFTDAYLYTHTQTAAGQQAQEERKSQGQVSDDVQQQVIQKSPMCA